MWHDSGLLVWQLLNASARASASVRSAHDRLTILSGSPSARHPQPAHEGEAERTASVARAAATTRLLRIVFLLASNWRANPANGRKRASTVSTHRYHVSRGESGKWPRPLAMTRRWSAIVARIAYAAVMLLRAAASAE